jgi:hypothetical protein
MKKVALSLAGVLAAVAFAPEASAVPAFARQTGMACNACHTQHFPILSGFGRAFKADGFTMMGAQEKIEGEHLSIPAVLNAGILLKARYRMTSGNAKTVFANGTDDADGYKNSTNNGTWAVPDEFGLFFGGRLTENEHLKVGTMIEHSMDNIVGFRIPMVTDVGSVKLSAIPFLTDALGPFYGYTESSTGLNRAIRWNEHHAEISAHRYVGMATGAASGLTFMAKAEMGYVTFTRWTPNFPLSEQAMSLNMVHVGATNNIAGFDTVLTAEFISGKAKVIDTSGTDYFTDAAKEHKATGFSAQANGEVAGMDSSFYATYAKGDAAGVYGDKQAFTVGTEITVIPHALHLGAAYRNAKNTGVSDNAITFAATYDVAQNLGLQATFSKYSGDKYNTVQATGDSMTTLLLETAW